MFAVLRRIVVAYRPLELSCASFGFYRRLNRLSLIQVSPQELNPAFGLPSVNGSMAFARPVFKVDLHRFCSGRGFMLCGPLFEGYGGFSGED